MLFARRKLPPELEAIRSSQTFKDAMDRLRRLVKRPLPSFAFVDAPLPNGVVAIVRLNHSGSLTQYAIVSPSTFNESVRMSVYCGTGWFQSARENDNSPATVTVSADGRMEATSEQLGATVLSGQIRTAHLTASPGQRVGLAPEKSARAKKILKRRASAPSFDVPGFGPARVVQR